MFQKLCRNTWSCSRLGKHAVQTNGILPCRRNKKEAISGVGLNRQCTALPSSVSVTCLNQRSFSSYEKIKGDTVLKSKEMTNVLKDYVGTGLYSDDEKENMPSEAAKCKAIVSQDELVPRSMKDSMREILIPLGDDPVFREKYLTFYKTVRIGKLLEDMDSLAGIVGYKYYEGPSGDKACFALVTASVDKFNIRENCIRSDKNIWLTGFVSYAGRTSLEITIYLGNCI